MEAQLKLKDEPETDVSGLRRGIWSAANLLRAAGLNPLEMIDHLSVFLFLRLWAQRGLPLPNDRTGDSVRALLDECSTSANGAAHFRDQTLPALVDIAHRLSSGHPAHAIVEDFQFRVDDPVTFSRLVQAASQLASSVESVDVNGAIYERLVASLSEAGNWGQFFTPRHIVDTMVELVDLTPGESVYDPAAGTGGFLLRAGARLRQLGDKEPALHGRELNRTVQRLCVMNLLTHGFVATGVTGGDSLIAVNQAPDSYDAILTNPPFAGAVITDDRLAFFPMETRSSESLFLQHIYDALKPGGRAAVVCPEGLLANLRSDKDLRRYLVDRASIDGVLSLPGGVFNPYTGVRTGILVFRKGEPSKRVWFFDVRNDGYSLDARRRRIDGSDLPRAVLQFKAREETDASRDVPVKELEEHDLRLVASRYLNGHAAATGAVRRAPLGSACSAVKDPVNPSEEPTREFTYVALEHIESRTGRLLDPPIALGREIKSPKTRFMAGDVLYGRLRPYLAKAVVAPFDGICSTEITVLRPSDSAVGEYLVEVLRSAPFTERANALVSGANHPRIHPRDLLKIDVPLPDVSEQEMAAAVARDRRQRADAALEEARRLQAEADESAARLWV